MGKKFYVVTVGKDVGVFQQWLQAAHVVFEMHCEKYETKEAAIKAFDEAMKNGFVKIEGSFSSQQPYKSPRIYPPLTSPPQPIFKPASEPPPPSPPTPAPAPRPSPFPSIDPSFINPSSFGDIPQSENVTIRSPKREKKRGANNTSDDFSPSSQTVYRNTTQSSPTKVVCPNCHCYCVANSCRVASPIRQRDNEFTGSSPTRERRRVVKEPKVSSAKASSKSVLNEGTTLNQHIASPISRARTVPILQITPRAPSSPISHSMSVSASPLAQSPSRYRRGGDNLSPTTPSRRVGPPIIISSDSESSSYPPASDSESESDSSGPEDITPPREPKLLLSPLTSPKLKNAGMRTGMKFVAASGVSGSPLKKHATTCSPISVTRAPGMSPRRGVNHESNDLGSLTRVPAVVYNNGFEDPRSPVPRSRVRAHGEPISVRPSPHPGPNLGLLFAA